MQCSEGLIKQHWSAGKQELKLTVCLQMEQPIPTTATAEAYYQRLASISRGNVLNGDYIKLRQITLGYTISEKAFAKILYSVLYRFHWLDVT